MELLTGIEQKKSWVDLLYDVIKEKDPDWASSYIDK